VGYTNSKVVLVGDPNCKVSATVVEANEMGIVGPGRPLDRAIVHMNFVSRTTNLKPGQTVVTSDLGGLFRKGIPIGKIADSSPMEYDLYTQARVKLEVNLNTLEDVWVILQ
jgi:rod shape-determining protein MreC